MMGNYRRSKITETRERGFAYFMSTTVRLLALGCLCIAGCGEPLPPDFAVADDLFPVTGEVKFKGEIAPEATLQLHPIAGPPGSPAVTAVVNADGKFQVFTFRPEGKMLGAPAGQYKVTASWLGSTAGLTQEKIEELKELVPPKFHRPQTTPLTIEVKSEANEVGVLAID
jgi:hypothetical protein